MPGMRQSSRQNEIPRVWPEGLVSHAEASRHAYFLHPHFLGLKVGDLSPKALCEESFGGPETGSPLYEHYQSLTSILLDDLHFSLYH